jgi:hypothetical protein
MSEKGENDQYRDRIKKADDGRIRELDHSIIRKNKQEPEKKKR